MGDAAPVLLGLVLVYLLATAVRGPDAPWPWDRARADHRRTGLPPTAYRVFWYLSLVAAFALVSFVFWRLVQG